MDKELTQLENMLRELTLAHRRLLELIQRKQAALRRADHKLVATCCHDENDQFQMIAEMEKRRMILVAQLTRMIAPNAPRPMKLGELAERLPEPARGRLLVLLGRLDRLLQLDSQHQQPPRSPGAPARR